jgi:formyl-CoA transferase
MKALEGITVLELASYVSGPYAGMMLSDLGAEVIKIEPPDGGDPFRGWGAADYSATFGSVNRNKKSVVLDLKTDDGLAAARALAEGADVLIENFRAGTMDRLGLGYETLKEINPRLIYASVTGFGPTGRMPPRRLRHGRPGDEWALERAHQSRQPEPMGISLSDHLTGMMAAYGILGALMARERTGRGQRVETSLLSATVAFLGENAARYFETGKTPSRETRARSAQVYAFVDSERKGFVVHLSSPTKFWRGLTQVAGHPEWQEDARFKTKRDRQENYRVLHGLLAEIFGKAPREAWLKKLEEHDVPSAPIYTLARSSPIRRWSISDLIRQVPHKKLGHVSLVGGGVTLSDTPPEIVTCAPDYGQHTDEILARIGRFKDAAK